MIHITITSTIIILCAISIFFAFEELFIQIKEKKNNKSKTEELLLEIEKTEKKLKESEFINAVEFLSVDMNINSFNKKSIDAYFRTLCKYMIQAKKSIKVVELMSFKDILIALSESENETNNDNAKFLGEKYLEYYNQIEECVKRKVKYQRIFQMPYIRGYHSFPLNQSSYFELTDESKLSLFSKIVNRKTLEHIKDTFNYTNESFYLCDQVNLPFSFMLIDNTIVISVYYSINKKGYISISELYVNRIDSLKGQIRKRISDFAKLIKMSFPIQEEELYNAIEEMAKKNEYSNEDSMKKLTIIKKKHLN